MPNDVATPTTFGSDERFDAADNVSVSSSFETLNSGIFAKISMLGATKEGFKRLAHCS
jgi:hypothetical protein